MNITLGDVSLRGVEEEDFPITIEKREEKREQLEETGNERVSRGEQERDKRSENFQSVFFDRMRKRESKNAKKNADESNNQWKMREREENQSDKSEKKKLNEIRGKNRIINK